MTTPLYVELLRDLDDPAAVPDAEQVRVLWLGHRAAAEAFERSAYPMVASTLRRQTETLARLLAACG